MISYVYKNQIVLKVAKPTFWKIERKLALEVRSHDHRRQYITYCFYV